MGEALNAMNALTDEIKAERDSYKSSTNLYKTSLEKEREDHRKQEKELMESNAQHREMMEMMQNNLLVVAQTLQERELQHVKELDELRKAHADRTTTKTKNEKQEKQEKQEKDEERKSEVLRPNTVFTPVTINERSETLDESQVTTLVPKRKPTTKKKKIKTKNTTTTETIIEMKNEKKNKTQEQYKKDKERKPKFPSKIVTHEQLTHDAWNKKRRHRYYRADPFRFDPRYKKRKKPGRKDGTIVVPQQKQKKTNDSLLYDAWSKKRKHKKKRS